MGTGERHHRRTQATPPLPPMLLARAPPCGPALELLARAPALNPSCWHHSDAEGSRLQQAFPPTSCWPDMGEKNWWLCSHLRVVACCSRTSCCFLMGCPGMHGESCSCTAVKLTCEQAGEAGVAGGCHGTGCLGACARKLPVRLRLPGPQELCGCRHLQLCVHTTPRLPAPTTSTRTTAGWTIQ
jgi:hypothetical protein